MHDRALYRVVRDVELPSVAVRDAGTGKFSCHAPEILPTAFAIVWPDGTPCYSAEMYLMSVASHHANRREDGGSLKVLAKNLSLLVRFLSSRHRAPWDLQDADMKEAIQWLQEEPDWRNPAIPRRNGNTIDAIQADWIAFLRWIQENLVPDRVIVGTPDESPQIPLVRKTFVDHRGRTRTALKYRYTPVAATPLAKGPISRETRAKLRIAIIAMSDSQAKSNRYRGRFKSNDDFRFQLDYLRRRRECLLDLIEATGSRPGELALLRASTNGRCTATGKLRKPVLKTRRFPDPELLVPIDAGVAIRLELLLARRGSLIERLGSSGREVHLDRIFLTVSGHPMGPATMEKEFSRIVRTAGISDEQVCLSMFRHRFITNMVVMHIRSFMAAHPSQNRNLITDSDYRTILRRVATFTGHRSEESLLPYIDLAWDELGAFDGVKVLTSTANLVERALNDVISLAGDMQPLKRNSAQHIIQRLRDLHEEMLAAINSEQSRRQRSESQEQQIPWASQ